MLSSLLKFQLSSVAGEKWSFIIGQVIRQGIVVAIFIAFVCDRLLFYCQIIIWVGDIRRLHLLKSVAWNIQKFVEIGKGDRFAGKVWDNSESGYWVIKYWTIQLTNDVCTSFVAWNNNKGSNITRSHFAVKWFSAEVGIAILGSCSALSRSKKCCNT